MGRSSMERPTIESVKRRLFEDGNHPNLSRRVLYSDIQT